MQNAMLQDTPQEVGMPDAAESERLKSALVGIAARLEREAEDRVSKRQTVEKRWLEDLRQFHGTYDPEIVKNLRESKKSSLFINQTRPKTNACEARLSDMLFPTDDKNWGINPTPVPELSAGAMEAMKQAEAMVAEANAAQAQGNPEQSVQLAMGAQQSADIGKKLKAEMDEAQKRAKAMSSEIEDQLVECKYAIHMRDVIHDACVMGTGISKGPVASTERTRRSWRKEMDPATGKTLYVMEVQSLPRPAFYRVDPWSFFPEPDALTLEQSESFFERHLKTPKEMRALAKQPGFDPDAIRRLLRAEPDKTLPTYLASLRDITGENQAPTDKRYQVWEYRGPLTAEEMRDLCACKGKQDMAAQYEDVDPLDDIQVVIWFCQSEILKFGIHHMDSGECIYSVFNLEKDDSSIWGFGIPYMMRDSQKAMNGAWRMMMDNAGLSSGPQIEVDTSVVQPADGKWSLTPRKIWQRVANAQPGKTGLTIHNIDSHQPELAGIIQLCRDFIDDETAISILAQGEQGAHTTQTSGGMAMLMNAVNVVFRRMVKNFDDDMTIPNIRRIYDWNMQFSEKEHIKGDFDVDARGTSVLLVREVQSQNLMMLANMTAHPVIGLLLKVAPLVRKLAQAMMIPADEIIKTDEELQQEAEAMKNQPQEPPPELTVKLKIAEMETTTRMQVAQMERDTEMMKLAQHHNMKLDELRTKLDIASMQKDSKERILATEVAVEAQQDLKAAANGQQSPGSGGYIR